MSNTFPLRQRLVALSRRDDGKIEVTKNRADWIARLWPATNYPEGMEDRQPYCAAGQCRDLRDWLKDPEVRSALGLSEKGAEQWRCKSAAVSGWKSWAKEKKLMILPKHCILHAGDLALYDYSHIELVVDDDGTDSGAFVASGYNTNAAGSRDGEGKFTKPRTRASVDCFIRILQ